MDQAPLSDPPPPTDSDRRRATAKEMRERIELVRRSLLSGKTRQTVRLLIAADWGLSPRQTRWYLARAEAEIKDAAARDKDAWLAEHIALRRDIRRRASDASDLRAELAAAESEAKLLGLEPPTRLEHSGPNGGPMLTEIVIEHHKPGDDEPPAAANPPADGQAPDGDGGRPADGPVPPGPDAGLEVYG